MGLQNDILAESDLNLGIMADVKILGAGFLHRRGRNQEFIMHHITCRSVQCSISEDLLINFLSLEYSPQMRHDVM